MVTRIKVLFNKNKILGLEPLKGILDDDYTVMSTTVENEEIQFVIFDKDIDNNIVDTESQEFVDDILNTFVLYNKSMTSKPLSKYSH